MRQTAKGPMDASSRPPAGMARTESTSADILDSRFPARAEALIGWVDRAVGK